MRREGERGDKDKGQQAEGDSERSLNVIVTFKIQ